MAEMEFQSRLQLEGGHDYPRRQIRWEKGFLSTELE